jgi:hypothetical protein
VTGFDPDVLLEVLHRHDVQYVLGSEFYVYSGHDYSTVPDSWGARQGKPET